MHKLAITALAVAMGIAWSALPATAAGTSTAPKEDKTVKEKAVETKDKVKEKTSEAWDKTKEKTSETWDKTKDKVKGTGDKAEDKAERAKDKAENKAERTADKADSKMDKAKDKMREAKDKVVAKADMAEVRQAQTALKDKGHDPGPIDGIHGPRTSAAVRSYQKAENLTVTGRLDDATKARLMGTAASAGSTSPAASPATSQPGGTTVQPGGATTTSRPAPPPASVGSPSNPPAQPEKTQKP